MNVEFVCEKCQKDVRGDLNEKCDKIVCPHCGNKVLVQLSESMRKGGHVDRCVLCDRIRFYVQKDFNPRLGILIFTLGVIFSYHTKFLSLVVATIIDVILYQVLKTVTVCYHCRAVYRDFEEDPNHRGFDHDLALSLVEKEEEEAAEAELAQGGITSPGTQK